MPEVRGKQEQQNQPDGSRPPGLPAPDIDLNEQIDQAQFESRSIDEVCLGGTGMDTFGDRSRRMLDHDDRGCKALVFVRHRRFT